MMWRAWMVVLGLVVLSACGDDDPLPVPAADMADMTTGADMTVDMPVVVADMGRDMSQPPPEDMGRDMAPPEDMGGAQDMGADMAVPPDPLFPAVYPSGQLQSPMTRYVAERLRAIAARDMTRQDDVFMKVGASNTVNTNHLHCFAGANVDLAGREVLQPTIDHFLMGDAAGGSPFERESEATVVGKTAAWALGGPVQSETAALNPRFGLIHYGTNEIGSGVGSNIFSYADNMLELTDLLISQGIIPVLTTIPPRTDQPEADAWVPRFNAVIRAIAQARQVPLVDTWLAMLDIPGYGLGGDGIHLNVYRPSGARGCVFTPEGLQYGHNVRNLEVLTALDRARRVVVAGEAAPDAPGAPLIGDGSSSDPIRVTGFPFTDRRDTAQGGQRRFNTYDGCNASQDESGAEFVYTFDLAERTTIRAYVFDQGSVDIDLHLLGAEGTTASCIERDHQIIERTLDPGTYHMVLDTYVAGGNERSGEFLFVMVKA